MNDRIKKAKEILKAGYKSYLEWDTDTRPYIPPTEMVRNLAIIINEALQALNKEK